MIEIVDEKSNVKFKLGRNAKENFQLIDEATILNDNYWWFHLDDHQSGHCIVHSEVVDNNMIMIAGNLVKQHSKLKNEKKVKIIYTQIKNIQKMKTMGEVKLLDKPLIASIQKNL
jgi:predicted ribosome quality control (RQC) complex YloA/Tae2 family protein